MLEKIKSFFKSLGVKIKTLIPKVALSPWYPIVVGMLCFALRLAESFVGMIILFVVLGITGYMSNLDARAKLKATIDKFNVLKE